MKKIFSSCLLLFAGVINSFAQNVGVDVASPVEKLDVLGAIRIGNTSNTNAGAIRWNSPNFQGYDGTQWVNFGGGTLTGSGTATRVAFWDGTNSLSSNTNLYWDNTNSRLGIGTATPSYTLQIYHTATNQGAGFFRVDNSSNNGSAVFASTNGGGSSSAIYAVNNGWGRAANFEINNSASDRHAIYASTNGIGHTIRVDQAGSGGRALYLQTGSSSNNNPTLYSNTFGTGYAGEFRIDNSGSSSAALYASTSGTGPAIEAGGKLKSTTFQMTASPTVNYVLRSDASGNATWVDPNTLITGLLPSGTSGQTLRHNGTNWIANSLLFNDGANIGIGTTNPTAKLWVRQSTAHEVALFQQGNSASFNTDVWWSGSTGTPADWLLSKRTVDGSGDFWFYNPTLLYSVLTLKQSGNVGIGSNSPAGKLDVAGKTKTTTFQMTNGSTNGYVLQGDGSGNATWVNPTSLSITETDPQVSSTSTNYIPKWNGTALVDGVAYDNGTNVGIGTTVPDYKLHVSGSDYLTLKLVSPNNPLLKLSGSYNSGNGAEFWQDNTGDARLNINGSLNAIYMKSSGDVGIGMAFPATPAARLDVNNGTSTVPIFVARDNGTEMMRIEDGGNVGIGTTTPGAFLDITGTNAGSTSLQLRSGNTGNGTSSNQLIFGYNGTETYRHAIKTRHNSGGAADNTIEFYVWKHGTDAAGTIGSQQVMTIDGRNGGSVGIGTTSPSSALDVRRSSNTDGDAISFGTPTYFMGRLGETATSNKVYIANTYNSDDSYIDFRLKGTAENNSKMVIKGDGKVGIGTTSPVSKLHVSGATFTLNGYNTNPIELISGGSLPVFKWYGNGNLYFSNDPNASNIGNEAVGTTQVMVLTPSGNVGIGTTSPSANLDVVGTVEMFGAWTSRSANTVYQAATDGFIVSWAGSAYFRIKTDGSNPPTTTRMEAEGNTSNAARPNIMCPVRKGDYWTVEGVSGGTPVVWWMPMGQ